MGSTELDPPLTERLAIQVDTIVNTLRGIKKANESQSFLAIAEIRADIYCHNLDEIVKTIHSQMYQILRQGDTPNKKSVEALTILLNKIEDCHRIFLGRQRLIYNISAFDPKGTHLPKRPRFVMKHIQIPSDFELKMLSLDERDVAKIFAYSFKFVIPK